MAWSASSRPAQRFPGIKLILNRGFEIVPRVRDKIQMVAAESLYRGWDANLKRYVEVPAKDRDWLLQQLQTIRERDKLPVLAIDYVAPHDRDTTRHRTAHCAAGHHCLGERCRSADPGHGAGGGRGASDTGSLQRSRRSRINYASAHRFWKCPSTTWAMWSTMPMCARHCRPTWGVTAMPAW
jgi:hypothetical protein